MEAACFIEICTAASLFTFCRASLLEVAVKPIASQNSRAPSAALTMTQAQRAAFAIAHEEAALPPDERSKRGVTKRAGAPTREGREPRRIPTIPASLGASSAHPARSPPHPTLPTTRRDSYELDPRAAAT